MPGPRASTRHFAKASATTTGFEPTPLWTVPCNRPRAPSRQAVVLARRRAPTNDPENYPWQMHVRLRWGPATPPLRIGGWGHCPRPSDSLVVCHCAKSCRTRAFPAQRLPHAFSTIPPTCHANVTRRTGEGLARGIGLTSRWPLRGSDLRSPGSSLQAAAPAHSGKHAQQSVEFRDHQFGPLGPPPGRMAAVGVENTPSWMGARNNRLTPPRPSCHEDLWCNPDSWLSGQSFVQCQA